MEYLETHHGPLYVLAKRNGDDVELMDIVQLGIRCVLVFADDEMADGCLKQHQGMGFVRVEVPPGNEGVSVFERIEAKGDVPYVCIFYPANLIGPDVGPVGKFIEYLAARKS